MSLSPPLSIKRQTTKMTDESEFSRTFGCGIVGDGSAVDVLMIGTGEYTTGYVHGTASQSDKGAGVVALTMFDLRSRGKTSRLGLCGVNGTKFQGIRAHLQSAIGDVYDGLDLTVETFPADDVVDPNSYIAALDSFRSGDAVTVFTPDDTHFDIALAAVQRGMHVLVTKPAVKTLQQHRELHAAALASDVLVAVEVHKRWDPIYADARDRIQSLGAFSYLYSYMSQPKRQLETFRSWAGRGSDISYYLNSHHIDFHEWAVGETSRPTRVTAVASSGVADRLLERPCEDTITLCVEWENITTARESDSDGTPSVVAASRGTAVYTSSWVAPPSDVHSQQRFHYMGQGGEVAVDQAHRGYTMADDRAGFRSVNPLFMKYAPSGGRFAGQLGYGYRSFEAFVDGVADVRSGRRTVAQLDSSLATIATTYRTTAILEAGRRSLDSRGPVDILYGEPAFPCRPTEVREAK